MGCKAIVYEEGDTRGSWASRGVDAFYLGPAKDHYRCDNYYVPETRAYHISGSTELFPQHYQLPSLTPHQHFRALTNELTEHTAQASDFLKGRRLLQLLALRVKNILNPPPVADEQRVEADCQARERETKQRVIAETPILTIPRITDAPPIMLTRNPTAKRVLKTTKRLHRRTTRNNTPGIVPLPVVIHPVPLTNASTTQARQRGPEGPFNCSIPFVAQPAPHTRQRGRAPTQIQPVCQQTSTRTALPSTARQCNIMRHAINILTLKEQASFNVIYIPLKLTKHELPVHFEHYANPMVHPVTGETISSYKKLMNDPPTADVWQTSFGKDFGGMAQGDNKTGQKGTNAMFVMTREDMAHAHAAGKNFHVRQSSHGLSPPKERSIQNTHHGRRKFSHI